MMVTLKLILFLSVLQSISAREPPFRRIEQSEVKSNPLNIFKEKNLIPCLACKAGVGALHTILSAKFLQDAIASFIQADICPFVKEIRNATMCPGITASMTEPVWAGILQTVLEPNYQCEIILDACTVKRFEKIHAKDEVDLMIQAKPASIQSNDYLNQLYESIKGQTRPTIRAVHFTDPHLDHLYTEGADIICTFNMCCRPQNGYPTEDHRKAKKWGSYYCDFPEVGIRSLLQFIKSDIKPKLFFWTGDNAAHDIWMNTPHDIIQATVNITNMIKEELAGEDIAYYPIQGNHDVWPVNVQDFSKPYQNEVINGYAPAWAAWLGPDATNEFKKYGYYMKRLTYKDGTPIGNTWVIGLNTQACNILNWYLLKTRYDPGSQLAWLEEQLHQIEQANGQAIIISHLSPLKECSHGWGHRFRGLMDRYQHIVRIGLYGHTHREDIQLVKGIFDNKNIGINFYAGSVTSHVGKNPSFNVIEFDEELLIPLNIKSYSFDLDKANTEGQPTWTLLHDYVSYYNLPDLRPDNIMTLANRILADSSVASQYIWDQTRRAGTKPGGCDEGCRRNLYCNMIATETVQNKLCKGSLVAEFTANPLNAFFNYVTDEWMIKH